MTRIDLDELRLWMRQRTERGDKTTMLLEHFLVLNFDEFHGHTVTTRNNLRDFTGWSPKTLGKAMETMVPLNIWAIEDDGHHLRFTPLMKHEPSEPRQDYSRDVVQRLIWGGSSLSGLNLLAALSISQQLNDDGEVSVPLRELASSLGIAVNTARKAVEEMVESGEWEKLMDPHTTRLRLVLSALTQEKPNPRTSLRVKTGPRLPAKPKSPSRAEELPFMLDDWSKMNSKTIRPFRSKRTVKGYAQRLLDFAKAQTPQGGKEPFPLTMENVTRVYAALAPLSSMEIVDTLLTYQVFTGKSLDLRFLKPVVNRLERSNGAMPVRFKGEQASSGAWLTAVTVYRVIAARRMSAHEEPETSTASNIP